MLQDWTEQYTYGAAYPESPMMIQACRHNSEDKVSSAKLCGECKAAMAGKIATYISIKKKFLSKFNSKPIDFS